MLPIDVMLDVMFSCILGECPPCVPATPQFCLCPSEERFESYYAKLGLFLDALPALYKYPR